MTSEERIHSSNSSAVIISYEDHGIGGVL